MRLKNKNYDLIVSLGGKCSAAGEMAQRQGSVVACMRFRDFGDYTIQDLQERQ